MIDAAGTARSRRDRIVDAVLYLVAFTIGFATLVDTWELHPGWLRPLAVVFGIAGVVSLHWRRSHPAAVGIFASAVSVVIVTSGANYVVLFNAAIRARGRDLAIIAGLTAVSCFTNPMLYRGQQSLELEVGAGLGLAGAALGWGLFARAAGAASIEVVGEADDGREVLGAVDIHRPDVVLMDIRMAQLDGIAHRAARPGSGRALALTRRLPGGAPVLAASPVDPLAGPGACATVRGAAPLVARVYEGERAAAALAHVLARAPVEERRQPLLTAADASKTQRHW